MNKRDRAVWFPAKRYGWGWGPPVCWQGWVVLLAYFALLALSAWYFLPADTDTFMLLAVALTAILIIICWLRGETPRWRWGGD